MSSWPTKKRCVLIVLAMPAATLSVVSCWLLMQNDVDYIVKIGVKTCSLCLFVLAIVVRRRKEITEVQFFIEAGRVFI